MDVDQFIGAKKPAPESPTDAAAPDQRVTRFNIGIWPNVPEAIYHADCAADGISASSSALKTLIEQSPMHAAYSHPRLNRQWVPTESTDAQIKGTILHSLMLDTPAPYRVLNFKDYRTDAAKAAKAQCFKDGKLPILADRMEDLFETASEVRNRLIDGFPAVWAALTDPDTMHEATLIFRRDGVLCRSRCDTLPPDKYNAAYDFKFTGREAEPEAWQRKLVNDYLIQAVLYPYGIEALRGDEPEFRYIVVEWDPPYGITVNALAPELAEIGRRRLNDALLIWQECVETGKWPGYPTFVHYAEPPGWLANQEESRIIARESAREWARREETKKLAAAAAPAIERSQEGPL